MSKLNAAAEDFVGQIAVAVWLGRLTDEAAREVLGSYASAYSQAERTPCAGLTEALLAEYRHRREGQDICS